MEAVRESEIQDSVVYAKDKASVSPQLLLRIPAESGH
jgi:hypothetical protein